MADSIARPDIQQHPVQAVDIAIIGGGMVGTALALALEDSPYSIALIDAQDKTVLQAASNAAQTVDQFEARVSALTVASKNLLDQLGAWQHIAQQQIMPYQKMHVWDELGTAKIDFDAAELYCNELGYIIENKTMIAALQHQLAGQKNLTAYWGNELEAIDSGADIDSNSHHLRLQDGRQIKCDLLVAADGANSRVRNRMGMATREWDYQHHAIVATVQTERKHAAVARQRFSESGPLAFLPLQDVDASEKFCSIVWSLKPDIANTMMSLNDEPFRQALEAAFESRLGAIEQVSQRYCFPLRQRHAKSYVGAGVVLVGDAAHTIHPLAGQGVNLGFKDVVALSQVLRLGGKRGVSCGDSVLLKRYQRQRQGDNLMMMGLMEGFKQLFEQKNPVIRWARNTGLAWVDQQGFIKNQIVRYAMDLSR